MREIKFRAWDIWEGRGELVYFNINEPKKIEALSSEAKIMQYTGLKDKNGKGSIDVYEGDIITIEGKIGGNIYENEPRRTDIVIPPIGTKAWSTAYKKAVDRGFDYSE